MTLLTVVHFRKEHLFCCQIEIISLHEHWNSLYSLIKIFAISLSTDFMQKDLF